MGKDNQTTENRLVLGDEFDEEFASLRTVEQEQLVFDSWRRTLQDWRHQFPEKEKHINSTRSVRRSVSVVGNDPNEVNYSTSKGLVVKHTCLLDGLSDSEQRRFIADFGTHIKEALKNRYSVQTSVPEGI